MSTNSEREPFVVGRFLEDLRKASEDLDVPYSEDVVKGLVDAYGTSFYDAAIQLRGCSIPGVPIMFRCLFAIPVDTLEIALKQGWLVDDDPMTQLHKGTKQKFPKSIEQPEFVVDKGLDGMFHYLGNLATLDEVLATPGMTDGVKAHRDQLLALGLNEILVIHNHYRGKTVSFYFLAKGPLTKESLDQYAALAGAPPPSDSTYQDIIGLLLEQSYYLTTVMDLETGTILRVEFHLFFPVKMPDDMQIPDVGERLESFWDIPTYDPEVRDECPCFDLREFAY